MKEARRAISIATLATFAILAASAAPARAIPLDPCDRFWAGSTTAQTNNINYPDEFAAYWGSNWTNGMPAGAKLVLHGHFPHARYMSFNTYNFNTASVHQPGPRMSCSTTRTPARTAGLDQPLSPGR